MHNSKHVFLPDPIMLLISCISAKSANALAGHAPEGEDEFTTA